MKKRLFVDKDVCTGCQYCQAVCSLVHINDNQVNPKHSRIIVYQDLANGIFTPVVCRYCTKPVCIEACQFNAMPIDSQLGIPIIDPQRCNGCRACQEVCPFGAIFFNSEQGVAIMCDLCGGDPQCVKFCRALPQVGYAAITYTTPEEWSKRKTRSTEANE